MAIEVACPSCQATVHVDEGLAGKDILCPSCKQRVTVPSIASGRPEPRAAAPRDVDEGLEEHDRPGRGRAGDLPRWGDDDYDVPARRDSTRWSATLTGLALIFWAWLIMMVMLVLMQGAALAMGTTGMMFGPGPGAGGAPPAGLMALGVMMMALGCGMIVLAIIAFVGLCMCCTVPSESGAKGRAVTTLILVILSFVGVIVFMVVMMFAGIRQAQQFGPGGPPPMPFSSEGLIAFTIVIGLDVILMATLWLMFHKAIADYFHNRSLARSCVLFLIVYIAVNVISNVLNFMSNPMLQGGNAFAMPAAPTPMLYVTSIFQLVSMVGLMTWYLLIVRETRRTIVEDEPARDDAGTAGEDV